jgi:hypothetical protein
MGRTMPARKSFHPGVQGVMRTTMQRWRAMRRAMTPSLLVWGWGAGRKAKNHGRGGEGVEGGMVSEPGEPGEDQWTRRRVMGVKLK